MHSWSSVYNPKLGIYFLKNGYLLKSCNVLSPSSGGRLEMLAWDSQVDWSYDFSSNDFDLHHDIEPMPNGNILVISYDVHTPAEAIAEGRNPATLSDEFWAEKIIEVEPVGSNSMNIIWEWRAWDHLVQEYDPGSNNYAVVANHPELLNINYSASLGPDANTDWLHFNGIAYNAELDQILISSRNMSEVFIIDHSTTTAEAAGHTGGTYGRGGDILYRFGNPASYNRGDASDRLLFFQHDAHWIPEGTRDEKKIIVFNNQVTVNSSSVDVFDPPIDSAGYYTDPLDGAFGPFAFDWSYTSLEIYSGNLSGAQRLPNGNTLICSGKLGLFVEVDTDGNIIWKYINPVGNTGPVSQGQIPNLNNVFKITRFAPDFAGFAGQELIPGDPIELNPLPNDCSIIEDTIADISLKVFLEGPFNNSEMATSLNSQGILPETQPFVNSPWNYNGTETIKNVENTDIVDWLLIDLRDADNPVNAGSSSIICRQAALLLANGSVVDVDGSSMLKFYNSIVNEMYVSVWHRNHLGILSSNPVSPINNYMNYDFTSDVNTVYGGINGHTAVGVNAWGMISGDGNSDGAVNNSDKDISWWNESGSIGYLQGDFNLDSSVDNKDKNDFWYINQSKNSQVPE